MATASGVGSAAQAQARQMVQKVYSEWCVKAAEIILAARVDDPPAEEAPAQSSASFSLKVPELFGVRGEAVARPEFFQLKTQRSFQLEIYLAAPDIGGGASSEEDCQLLERWTFTFFPVHPEPAVPDRCNQTLVRKLSVTLRSLLCFTRLLPAYGFCKGCSSARLWRCRVEAWPPTSRTTTCQELMTQDFVSLQSSVGTLRLSVGQRKDLKALQQQHHVVVPQRGPSAYGAQIDIIEVEEGYFGCAVISPTVTSPSMPHATALGVAAGQGSAAAAAAAPAGSAATACPVSTGAACGGAGASEGPTSGSFCSRLGKIAEEPEARAAGRSATPAGPAQPAAAEAAALAAALATAEVTATSGEVAGAAADSPAPGYDRCGSRTGSPRVGAPGYDPAPPRDRDTSGGAFSGTCRPRYHSGDSAASSAAATSSSRYSAEVNVVALGATPPLAFTCSGGLAQPPGGLITLGPQSSGQSVSSSRSATPQSTPNLRPAAPPRIQSSSPPPPEVGDGLGGGAAARCSGVSGGGGGTAVSRVSGTAGFGASSALMAAVAGLDAGDDVDDLSNIWMRAPPEWGRRRSMSLASRGSHSRSVTPDAQLASANEDLRRQASGSLEERATSFCGGAGSASANTSAAGGADGEICMFGMSDNEAEGSLSEEEDASQDGGDDEELLGRNVVASAIQEGGLGGAFASPGASKMMWGSLEGLGPPADLFADSEAPNFASPKLMSPLIAGLNPFTGHLPNLDLPPSAGLSSLGGGGHFGESAWGLAAAGEGGIFGALGPSHGSGAAVPPSADGLGGVLAEGAREDAGGGAEGPVAIGAPDVRPDVQHLLVEMGDLVCQLQRKEELALTSQEASPEAMLAKLDHFRELATSMGLTRRG